MIRRRTTKKVWVGKVPIGGAAPISVQSMTKTDTRDVPATIKQIRKLERAGCEIIRVAVLDMDTASVLSKIKREIRIPLVADIHFDYRLALKAINSGVDKLRINPGNIGPRSKIKEVVRAAKERQIPIRVAVNQGSLPRHVLAKHKRSSPSALVDAALRQVILLEDLNFDDIVVSLKCFDVFATIEAYQLVSKTIDYPLHLGITEAGLPQAGSVRSALGIGMLLASGIGDTIRVSLTSDPIEEVKVGYEILKSLNLREHGPTIISCPTCGRCEIDIISLTKKVERKVRNIRAPLRIAVMGCVVNGPGEAKDADVGIAGGKGYGLLFRNGEVVGKAKEEDLVDGLLEMMQDVTKDSSGALTHQFLEFGFPEHRINLAGEWDSEPPPSDSELIEVVKDREITVAKEILHVAQEHIATIKKLERFVMENAREVPDIHKFLAQYPWILDPTWTQVCDEAYYSKLLHSRFPDTDLDEPNRRIDFICLGTTDTIHVVELKRPKHKINKEDLAQLESYVAFVRQRLGNVPGQGYHAAAGYIVAGEILDHYEVRDKIQRLERDRLYVKKYEDLLSVARRLNDAYIKKLESLKK